VRFSFQGGTYSLGQLLPMRFKPSDLLPDPATPLLLQPQHNSLRLTAAARDALQACAGDEAFEVAAAAALREAAASYAPYSRCPAGLAIVTQAGRVYSGGYVESAAYNPSLPPLQTAIVNAVIGAWGLACRWGGVAAARSLLCGTALTKLHAAASRSHSTAAQPPCRV
jgi:cytidine deaminase